MNKNKIKFTKIDKIVSRISMTLLFFQLKNVLIINQNVVELNFH